MTWLVTGGAGYIGSHVVKAFTAAGVDCLIVDSLSSGHRSFVPPDVPLVVASILDTGTVARAMAEHHVTGVVHLAVGQTPKIFGNDYSTPDGTCVRDFVHVTDLATSHVAAARALDSGVPLERVYNLGSGEGVSVHQIMNTARQVTEIDFEPEIVPRRPGDPDRIVAAGDLAARDLDWRMRHTLEDMVSSAYHAQRLAAHTWIE